MKVYVLIFWFYEGDSNLVDSYKGVFSTYEKAKKEIPENMELVTTEEAMKNEYSSCGSYGDAGYYEIREEVI